MRVMRFTSLAPDGVMIIPTNYPICFGSVVRYHLRMRSTACVIALGLSAIVTFAKEDSTPALLSPSTQSSETASNIVAATKSFVSTLSNDQRAKGLFDFKDEQQRKRWSNLPTPLFQRAGLRMGDLTKAQREAVMKILAVTTSRQGYEKVTRIIEAEEVLNHTDHPANLIFGSDEFYISILGAPSIRNPWLLQFGGHHLALNITIIGDQDVLTPSLIAVQPARYTVEGKTIRPLGRENDKAFALINALDAPQRKQAILDSQMRDLVLGPGQDGRKIQPEGIKASALDEKQQAMLLDLVFEWVGIINDGAAAAKMAEIKQNLAETWFAWSGPTENGRPAYFRIQGPTVVIEYAPQGIFGDATQHIHTMYRDPTNDYGKKLLKL